jgi:hypothetical protein
MGRRASCLARLCWTILIVLVAACQKGDLPLLPDADVIVPALIEPTSDTMAVPPGGSHRLGFHLLGAQREPVPGAVMSFSILDNDDTPGSGGARLSLSSGLTDEQGWVILQVIAGAGSEESKPLSFSLRASAGDVVSILPIFVTSGDLASAEIEPVVEPGEEPVSSISVYFLDDTVCADVDGDTPVTITRPGGRPGHDVSLGQSTLFTNVVASGVHAVLAVAKGARDKVIARGCVDLPGNSLSAAQPMLVQLPLDRAHVSAVGTYLVQATLSLKTQQPGIAAVREQWKILSNQTCDPASIWLDCTIDALSGDTHDDPLDCQPVAGGEGTLGALLSAKRSVSGGGRICANQVDVSGRTSLDARTYALFATTSLTSLSLASLPDEVSTNLSALSLQSTLTVVESGLANVLNIEHALNTLALTNAIMSLPIPVKDLGLPVPDAWFASRQSSAGKLELGSHGFTLRFGSLARLVYYKSSLVSRLGTADAGSFIAALFNGASRNSRSTTLKGCDALDSLLCDEAGLDRGCITAACQTGLEKLAQILDSSFYVLDGPNLDFFLTGWAPMVDDDGDGQADRLSNGWLNATFNARIPSSATGYWSAKRILPGLP